MILYGKRLYGLGARKIVFDGLGPLGCIPSQRVKSRNGECLTLVNQYVKLFNSRVQKLLTSLDSQLSGSHFSFADSYSIVLDLIENPGKYGINTRTLFRKMHAYIYVYNVCVYFYFYFFFV